ncbi:methyl-accepting chemotaxis protein [Roseateles asaccharophilus]|uniref:Methyl-accepting chemotaxis protein n=1 Tax=Roseateles asaccharophilus TaxID=582607 RepID=A0ABU2ACA3_9BURK|nr:methyl-accepting chemotaxis protein [Roseateles asaccharophilus]MDR7334815.1 methyl-accepting chemotaxis protein [Roseateles asaccharophilus]
MTSLTASRQRGLRFRLLLGFGVVLSLMVIMAAVCAQRLSVIHTYNTSLDERAYRLSMANQWLSALQIAAAKESAADPQGGELAGKLQGLVSAGSEKSALQAAVAAAQQPVAQQEEAVKGLVDAMVKLQIADSAMLQQASRQAFVLLPVLTIVSLIVGIAIAIAITRSITAPVAQAVLATQRIAEGDLSQLVESDRSDELGTLLRGVARMQLQLRDMLAQVRRTSNSIDHACSEIASGNVELSQRTEVAASNLQQAASSVEELSSTMRQSAESAASANQLAGSAAGVARRGGDVVADVVSTMADIDAGSKRIADIIGVIDGIAFQTNILALNAAVEAARAGDQGRGFAVVAGEVRSLAQRSPTAAKEIKSLIIGSTERVESGSSLVRQAGSTMSEIVQSVQHVTEVINGISLAASEQQAGIAQINQTVTELDRMTQQNAALSEQTTAAAESLRTQAHELKAAVGRFRLS